MALVKFGGGVIQMSGSIAGNTYARNRYGNYVRARTKPVNPNSSRQQAVRAAMAALTTRWSATLTAAQRTAWNLYASSVTMLNRLGESVNLSGFNHYIRSNMIFESSGQAPVDAGPVVFEIPAADPTLSFTGTEAGQTLSITYDDALAWADENGAFLHIFEGQPQNLQRNFFDGPWRRLGSLPGVNGAPPAPPLVLATAYGIAEGQRSWIYCRIQRADGRLSQPFRADAFIGA